MTIWYTVRNTFDVRHSGWTSYIKWSGLTQTREIISLDHTLCNPILEWDSQKEQNWEFIITTENELFSDMYSNLEYVISKLQDRTSFNLLAVCYQPESSCDSILLNNFTFIGYDLLDQVHTNSALTNCNGFPNTFANSELNKYGLLDSFERAKKIKIDLLINNPNEYHADTNMWAVWRHNKKKNKP